MTYCSLLLSLWSFNVSLLLLIVCISASLRIYSTLILSHFLPAITYTFSIPSIILTILLFTWYYFLYSIMNVWHQLPLFFMLWFRCLPLISWYFWVISLPYLLSTTPLYWTAVIFCVCLLCKYAFIFCVYTMNIIIIIHYITSFRLVNNLEAY